MLSLPVCGSLQGRVKWLPAVTSGKFSPRSEVEGIVEESKQPIGHRRDRWTGMRRCDSHVKLHG